MAGKTAKAVWIYMTAASRSEARRIARVLVEEGLVACVNVLGPIESVYRWKGRVESGREIAFVAKAVGSAVPAVARRVKELHSYECPCVVALPIVGGHAPFLAWIKENSRTTRRAARLS